MFLLLTSFSYLLRGRLARVGSTGALILAGAAFCHASSFPVLRLPSGPRPDQIAQAKAALENGSVVAMKNADPKRFGTMFNVAVPNTQDPSDTAPVRYCTIAVRRTESGALRTFVGPRVMAGPNDLQFCEDRFQRWMDRQSLFTASDSALSPWTEVSSNSQSQSDQNHNAIEVSPVVYRASTTDSYHDYFMVILSNESTVNTGALTSRSTTITTDLTAAKVFEDAPGAGTLGDSSEFTIGESIMVQPTVQPGFTQRWSQQTTQLGRNGAGKWVESWQSNPLTSGSSTTYEGAIFQVPKGTTNFALQITTQSSFTTGTVALNNVSFSISAPTLSAPADYYVLQGARFNIAVRSSKLNWQFTGWPVNWDDVDDGIHSGTKNITVTVPADAAENTVYPFTIDSQPAFASPSVAAGGLQVRVHVVPQLPKRGILFAGGYGPDYRSSATAEIFDPATNQITATANSMTNARQWHTATLLGNGKVLLAGGVDENGVALASTDLFDPSSGTFTAGPFMSHKHTQHTATLLQDGTVLIAGGFDETKNASTYAEVYTPGDPGIGVFSPAVSMSRARGNAAASLLQDGSVLITGGTSSTSDPNSFQDAELYDPNTPGFSPLKGQMYMDRRSHASVTLDTGQVLLIGGDTGNDDSSGHSLDPIKSIEIFDPQSKSFSKAAQLSVGRRWPAAALQPDGQVFFVGGDNSAAGAEFYDPSSETWYDASNFMRNNRTLPTLVFVHDTNTGADGLNVVAGGATGSTDVEVFNRDQQGWNTAAHMNLARLAMTSTLFGVTVSPVPAQSGGLGVTSDKLRSTK